MWFASTASAGEAEVLRGAEQSLQEAQARRDNPQEAQHHFRQAADEYARLGELGIVNSDLLRNEGNAFLLAGDLPRAILAYRRGVRLAPGDATLEANLRYAREQVDYPSGDGFGRPSVDNWPPWAPRPTLSALLLLTLLGYTAGLIALTRWWMTRRGILMLAGFGLLGIALLPFAGVVHEAWQQHRDSRMPLVVIASNHVPLRNGDGAAYPARYDGRTANRGVEARLLFERGDWLRIELAGGETGWVRRTEVLVDSP